MLKLEVIRKNIIIALFTDDDFFDKFVLKGGNALIFHGINQRASTDIDVSMEDDFDTDLDIVKDKLNKSLVKTFSALNYHVIDVKLIEKPDDNKYSISKWGGYELIFKLVTDEHFNKYKTDIAKLRRLSECVSEDSNIKKFSVDISKYEYCKAKMETEIDNFPIYIYTPMMILLEKLRAICQQHKEYKDIIKTHHPRPRSRDFFDIYSIMICNPDLKSEIFKEKNLKELINIFSIKDVPLNFLELISNYRDFHFANWGEVKNAVTNKDKLETFDFYFDRVVEIAEVICEKLSDLDMMDSILATD